jgi:hypothetical protein
MSAHIPEASNVSTCLLLHVAPAGSPMFHLLMNHGDLLAKHSSCNAGFSVICIVELLLTCFV